jgi:hypothetical protein
MLRSLRHLKQFDSIVIRVKRTSEQTARIELSKIALSQQSQNGISPGLQWCYDKLIDNLLLKALF